MHLCYVNADHALIQGPWKTYAKAKKMKIAPRRRMAKTIHRPQLLNELFLHPLLLPLLEYRPLPQ